MKYDTIKNENVETVLGYLFGHAVYDIYQERTTIDKLSLPFTINAVCGFEFDLGLTEKQKKTINKIYKYKVEAFAQQMQSAVSDLYTLIGLCVRANQEEKQNETNEL